MKFLDTEIDGVRIIEPRVHGDERGFFLETFRADVYREELGGAQFVQDNHSRSSRGVLRGLHMQTRKPQGKLVRCVLGEIFDVAVDLRPGSITFGQWVGVHLSAENHRQLYIPEGLAHGFQVISKIAEVEYKCTDYYDPDGETGLLWNDPDVAIAWPLDEALLSEKDQILPTLSRIR